MFDVFAFHGALRGLCGLDHARTGQDRQNLCQTNTFVPGTSFPPKVYTSLTTSDDPPLSHYVNPPAPQGAVPRTHQAHQDQLGVSLAELALEAVHWNPRPTASESIGLVFFFSLRSTRAMAIDVDIGNIPCAAIGRLSAARPVSGRPPPPDGLGCECPRGFAGS